MAQEQTDTVDTEQDQDKSDKKFQAAMKKLVAIVGGKDNIKIPKKTPKDQLGDLVAELFKEERENTAKETRDALKSLLKQNAEMEKAFAIKQKELDTLKKQKKEEFTKAASAVFDRIEGVGDVENAYYTTLKDVATK